MAECKWAMIRRGENSWQQSCARCGRGPCVAEVPFASTAAPPAPDAPDAPPAGSSAPAAPGGQEVPPCPFCGAAAMRGNNGTMLSCRTRGCVMHPRLVDRAAWSKRAAPASATQRHPNADAARLVIVGARRLNSAIGADLGASSNLRTLDRIVAAERYLRQALDALHPVPAPPSAAFWLGEDGL